MVYLLNQPGIINLYLNKSVWHLLLSVLLYHQYAVRSTIFTNLISLQHFSGVHLNAWQPADYIAVQHCSTARSQPMVLSRLMQLKRSGNARHKLKNGAVSL